MRRHKTLRILCLFSLCAGFAHSGWGQESRGYVGRQPFEVLSKDKPAIAVHMTRELKAAKRYAIPMFAIGAEAGQSIADIGCGNGDHTLQLAEAVTATGRMYARDINPKFIESLRAKVIDDEITER